MNQILNDDENTTLGEIVTALQGIEQNLSVYASNQSGLNQMHCMMSVIITALVHEYERLTQFQD